MPFQYAAESKGSRSPYHKAAEHGDIERSISARESATTHDASKLRVPGLARHQSADVIEMRKHPFPWASVPRGVVYSRFAMLFGSGRSAVATLRNPYGLYNSRGPTRSQQYHKLGASRDAVQILSVTEVPLGVKISIGGLVGARSVKSLRQLHTKAFDVSRRDEWWDELRDELRSHAFQLRCPHIIGYRESADIHDDVCVMSVIGTAVRMREPLLPARRRRGGSPPRGRSPMIEGRRESMLSTVTDSPIRSPRVSGETGEGALGPSATIPELPEAALGPPAIPIEDDGADKRQRLRLASQGSANSSGSGGALGSHESPAIRADATSTEGGTDVPPGASSPRRHISSGTSGASAADGKEVRHPHARHRSRRRRRRTQSACSYVHTPLKDRAPFGGMKLMLCSVCKKKWVPEILLTTIEPPRGIPVKGASTLVEARVCIVKDKSPTVEKECSSISDELFFLEMEMHQQLTTKMKLLGRNAVFSLRSTVVFNSTIAVGTMSGTAVLLDGLPPPPRLRIPRSLEGAGVIARQAALEHGRRDLQGSLNAFAQYNANVIKNTAAAQVSTVHARVQANAAKDALQSSRSRSKRSRARRARLSRKSSSGVHGGRSVHSGAFGTPVEEWSSGKRHGGVRESPDLAAGETEAGGKHRARDSESGTGDDFIPYSLQNAASAGSAEVAAAAAAVLSSEGGSTSHTATPASPVTPVLAARTRLASHDGVAALDLALHASPSREPVRGSGPHDGGRSAAINAPHSAAGLPGGRLQPPTPVQRGVSESALAKRGSGGDGAHRRSRRPSVDGGASSGHGHSRGYGSSSSSSDSGRTSSSSSTSSGGSRGGRGLRRALWRGEGGREGEWDRGTMEADVGVKEHYVVELGVDALDSLVLGLDDLQPPPGISLCTTDHPVLSCGVDSNVQFVSAMRRVKWTGYRGVDRTMAQATMTRRLAKAFHDVHATLCFKLRGFAPCTVCSLKTHITLPEDGVVELLLTGMAVREAPFPPAAPAAQGVGKAYAVVDGQLPLPPLEGVTSEIASSGEVSVGDGLAGAGGDGVDGVAEIAEASREECDPAAAPGCLLPMRIAKKIARAAQEYHGAVMARSVADVLSHDTAAMTGEAFGSPAVEAGDEDAGRAAHHSASPTARDTGTVAHEDAEADAAEGESAGHRSSSSSSSSEDGSTSSDSSSSESEDDTGARRTRRRPRLMSHGSHRSASSDEPKSPKSTRRTPRHAAKGSLGPMPQLALTRTGGSVLTPRVAELSPLTYVPGARIVRYLGRVNLHFVRESWAVRQGGGLGTFFFVLLSEANAMARAHVAAMGGNAVVGYRVLPRESTGQLSKNQAYHMVSVSGDAVEIEPLRHHAGYRMLSAEWET